MGCSLARSLQAFNPIIPSTRHRTQTRRTAAAAATSAGASAQSLLKAVFGRKATRGPGDAAEGRGTAAGGGGEGGLEGGGDPVEFPSRFTRRLQLDGDDQEGVDEEDEGENKSRLISQVNCTSFRFASTDGPVV